MPESVHLLVYLNLMEAEAVAAEAVAVEAVATEAVAGVAEEEKKSKQR